MNRIHDLIEARANTHADHEAVVDGTRRVSYSQLHLDVERVAKALLAMGVKRGDRVATLAPPCYEFLVSFLGAVSIGAIWHGLNPRYQSRDYQYLLSDAQPSVVFCVSPYDGRSYDAELQALDNTVEQFVTIGAPQGSAKSFESFLEQGALITHEALSQACALVESDDCAVIVYTSGTTGKPKGAMLSHRAITELALINVRWMGDGLRKAICPAPINHIGGLNHICMNLLAYGGTLIFHHRVDPAELARLNMVEQPTYLVSSPTAFIMLLENPAFSLDLFSSYRLVVFGGAATPKPVLERFLQMNARFAAVYGQTETCGIVTHSGHEDSLDDLCETVGFPIEGATVRFISAEGRECADGEIGEMQFKAPFLMSGYYNKPEATAEAFTADGFLRTGDLGYRRPDGRLVFTGRLKEMFKSGGYNVYPLEIEQTICEHPAVSNAVVMAMPDAKFQEVGFAFVTLKAGRNLDEPALRSYLKERIANFKVPKRFEFLPSMPTLPNSKVDRQQLKAELEAILQEESHR